jgi:hypothetical protein
MPILDDWVKLAKETFHAVKQEDVAELYSREWQGAKAQLIAERRDEIELAPTRFRKALRTSNAVLIGLARRLAPTRRLMLGGALLSFVFSLFGSVSLLRRSSRLNVEINFGSFLLLGFILLLLLLAMELVDKLQFRDELVLARKLQKDLMPAVLPQVPGFEIGAFNRIANMVGGDLYDFEKLPDGRLALLFGDASGHGMTAGLIMAVASAAFRTQLEVDPSPTAIVGTLNRILCRTGGPRSFFSAIYLLLSPDGNFVATVAGHPPALVLRADGSVRKEIGKGAYPLGIKDGVAWESISSRLDPGEGLLLHSDGLPESRNAAGEEFGDGNLLASLRRNAWLPPTEIAARIGLEVESFCGRIAPEDDISIVLVRRLEGH